MTLEKSVSSQRRKDRRDPLDVEILLPRQQDRCFLENAEVLLDTTPGSVREHNHELLKILNEVRLEVQSTGSIQLTPSFCRSIMRKLCSVGASAYKSLGRDFVKGFRDLERDAGEPGLALTIKSYTFPLLWEMLYTGSPYGEIQSKDFWGFRHRVTRYQLGSYFPEKEIDSSCDFLFGHYHRLSHWQQEHKAIERLVSRHFRFRMLEDILSESCTVTSTHDLNQQFIKALMLPELGFLHLACHGLATSSALKAELIVSWQSQEIRIRLHELQAVQEEKDEDNTFGFSLRPLVFLNACKTMTNPEHLLQGESFPREFLRFGASGVIATACDVPDQFAAAFAVKFYENLCEDVRGCSPTVSEALLKTRQFFIKSPYYNPLGLAYGLYGHNDLHIRWEPRESYRERATKKSRKELAVVDLINEVRKLKQEVDSKQQEIITLRATLERFEAQYSIYIQTLQRQRQDLTERVQRYRFLIQHWGEPELLQQQEPLPPEPEKTELAPKESLEIIPMVEEIRSPDDLSEEERKQVRNFFAQFWHPDRVGSGACPDLSLMRQLNIAFEYSRDVGDLLMSIPWDEVWVERGPEETIGMQWGRLMDWQEALEQAVVRLDQALNQLPQDEFYPLVLEKQAADERGEDYFAYLAARERDEIRRLERTLAALQTQLDKLQCSKVEEQGHE